jgi:hypothetical protein
MLNSSSSSMPLRAAAERIGGFVWTERRLFELLSSSIAVVEDPAGKVLVDRHGAHAAWRADQWWDRLPVLGVIDRDALVVPPSDEIGAVYDEIGGSSSAVARLAGIYRVAFPRLAAEYRSHRSSTSDVADGAVRRTLDQVERDLYADRAEGEPYLHSLLIDGSSVDAAAASVSRLERVLARSVPERRPAGEAS